MTLTFPMMIRWDTPEEPQRATWGGQGSPQRHARGEEPMAGCTSQGPVSREDLGVAPLQNSAFHHLALPAHQNMASFVFQESQFSLNPWGVQYHIILCAVRSVSRKSVLSRTCYCFHGHHKLPFSRFLRLVCHQKSLCCASCLDLLPK